MSEKVQSLNEALACLKINLKFENFKKSKDSDQLDGI